MIAIAAAALTALAIGFAFNAGWGWMAFSFALLALLLYHLGQLGLLARWLERGETPDPPRAFGAWDLLHALLYRSRRDAASRQAELIAAVKRWQEATRALPEGVVILENDRIEWLNDVAHLHLDLDPVGDIGRAMAHLVRIPEFVEYLDAGSFGRPIIVESPHAVGRAISIQVIPYGGAQRLVLSRDVTQFRAVDRMRRELDRKSVV